MRKNDARIGEGWGVPEQATSEEQWTFIHCVPGSELHLVLLSDQPATWISHWFGQKRRTCKGANCMFCARQSRPVRRFLMSVWDLDLRGRCVFEFGEPTMNDFVSILDGADTGRGMAVRIYKDGRSKRSRICARKLANAEILLRDEFGDPDLEAVELPVSQAVKPIVRSILERMEAEELAEGRSVEASAKNEGPALRAKRTENSIPGKFEEKLAKLRDPTIP